MEHSYNTNDFCPICDHKESKHFISATDHNVSNDTFNIAECLACGLKYSNPKIKEENIGAYYKSENYISHSNTNKGIVNKIYHIIRKYQIKKKEKIISGLCKEKTLIDIGCGTGDYLNYCKEKKWMVCGLEPDENAKAFGENNYQLNIYSDLKSISNKKVNIITLWHSLEHIYNLKNDLKLMYDLLNTNGHLVVAVPNCNSFDAKYYKNYWAAYDVPIHLYHFNKNNIQDLAKMFGFTVIKIKPMIFDSFYISMLSEKKKNSFMLKGLIIGLISNLKAIRSTNHSSLIYILRKN